MWKGQFRICFGLTLVGDSSGLKTKFCCWKGVSSELRGFISVGGGQFQDLDEIFLLERGKFGT